MCQIQDQLLQRPGKGGLRSRRDVHRAVRSRVHQGHPPVRDHHRASGLQPPDQRHDGRVRRRPLPHRRRGLRPRIRGVQARPRPDAGDRGHGQGEPHRFADVRFPHAQALRHDRGSPEAGGCHRFRLQERLHDRGPRRQIVQVGVRGPDRQLLQEKITCDF